MRRRLALLATVVLGLAALWWLWPSDAPLPPATAGSETAAGAVDAADAGTLSRAAEAAAAEAPQVPDGGAWLRVVSSTTGEPLAGASVTLTTGAPPGVKYHTGHTRLVDSAVTDEQGYAVFDDLTYPWLDASISRLFYDEAHFRFVPNTTRAIAPLPPWHGLVLDAHRRPVAGARVSSLEPPVVSTTSAEDGSFSLQVAVFDWLVGEKDGAVGTSVFLNRQSIDGHVEIVLGEAEKQSARVTDRAGKPLADVEVGFTMGSITLHQRTGGDGLWFWPALKNAKATATFLKAGYIGQKHEGSLYSRRPFADVVLSRGATVEGTVVNPDKSPVTGARVWLFGSSPSPLPEAVETDARGRFAIAGVGAESLSVIASLGERRGEAPVEVADAARTHVTVVLAPELTDVPLEVLEVDGGTVEDVEAVATPVPDTGWKSALSSGELALCRGRFRLQVTAGDGREAELTVDVDPREGMPPLRVVLPPLPPEVDEEPRTATPLKVRVRTPEGHPVAGAEVTCVDGSAVTNAEGLAELEANLRDRDWPLHVSATLGEATGLARPTSAASVIDVTLRPRRTLRGRVLGQLPTGGELVVTYRSGTQNDTAPLVGNAFAIEGVDAIRTFVCVRHDVGPMTVKELGCAVVEGAEEAVIEVGPPGAVELTAVDAAGKPIAEPLVYIDRMGRAFTETPDGKLHLEVSPGSHVIVLNATASRARFEARFNVRPGATTQLGVAQLR